VTLVKDWLSGCEDALQHSTVRLVLGLNGGDEAAKGGEVSDKIGDWFNAEMWL